MPKSQGISQIKMQMRHWARLKEIAAKKFQHTSIAKATTYDLRDLGYVEFEGHEMSHDLMRVYRAGTAHITDAGRRALAEREARR